MKQSDFIDFVEIKIGYEESASTTPLFLVSFESSVVNQLTSWNKEELDGFKDDLITSFKNSVDNMHIKRTFQEALNETKN